MDESLSKLGNWKKHLEAKSQGRRKAFVVFVEKVLEVIQFLVVGVSYGSIKNALASKVN